MEGVYLCLGIIFLGAIALGALVFYAITRPKSSQNVATSERAYLSPNQRIAIVNILAQVRVAPDMPEALDNATRYIETAMWLPTAGALPETPPELLPGVARTPQTAPPTPPVTGVPTTTTTVPTTPSVPATAFYQEPPNPGTPAVVPTVAPVMDAPPTPAAIPTPPPTHVTAPIEAAIRWVAPDTITILLYVGAALFVIAAGVFVGSSWDAISGFARFMIVAASALGFLVVGEAFVRFTDKLDAAGNTFRSIGTVLLPFTALAFDRFVLGGSGSPLYWVVVGLLLMLINYGLYRLSQRGRLTGFLAAFSYGIFANALPAALGLERAWTAASIWLVAGLLFLITARIAPDGKALVRQFFRKANHPLAESHFVMGWLLLGTGLLYLSLFDAWATLVSFSILTVILLGLTLYLDFALLLGIAGVTVGVAAAALFNAIAPSLPNGEVIALAITGVILTLIAPFVEKRIKYANGILATVGFGWTVVARIATDTDDLTGHIVTLAAYLTATVFIAYRFRNVLTWMMGWIVLNVAVFDILSLFPSESGSVLVPALLMLGLAMLWLVLEARPPYPDAEMYALVSFVVQAGLTSAMFMFVVAIQGLGATDVPLAFLLTTAGLTVGWLWLVARRKTPIGIVPTLLEGAAALVGIAMVFALPTTAVSWLWLIGGVGVVVASWFAPQAFRRITNVGGLFLAAGALFGSVAGDVVGLLPPSGVPTLAQTAQLVLTGAVVLYIVETVRQRENVLVFASLALVYCLVAWLTLDYLPAPLVPIVALGLGVATLLVAPVVSGQAGKLLELIGYGVVFLAPYAGIAAGRFDTEERFFGFDTHLWAQVTLILGALVYTIRGMMRRQRAAIAVAGLMVYLCYGWVAIDREIETAQVYSVPLALLLYGYSWLFTTQRRVWEVASVFVLLSVAGLQTLSSEAFLYSLVLGAWGLLLLIVGITLNRRVLLVGGVSALIFAALRQLWEVVSSLPPAAIIALVGLVLMVVAVVLTLTRDRWMKRLQGQ